MVNSELHCVQLFIRYIYHITTHMVHKLQLPLYTAARCIESYLFLRNAPKNLIIPLRCFPSLQCWGPMTLSNRYDWELTRAAPSTPERRHLHISKMYFSLCKPPGVSERMCSVNL